MSLSNSSEFRLEAAELAKAKLFHSYPGAEVSIEYVGRS